MPASEIILNADHSVYHLHLKNGEVPQKVITVGDPDRIDWILPHLDHIEFDRSQREFRTVKGRLGAEEILVISTGIGTDNIDIVLNELHLAYCWDLQQRKKLSSNLPPLQVIRLGTSGTLRPEIPLDSILMSEGALGFDYLMYFYHWTDYETVAGLDAFPRPYRVMGSENLRNRFRPMADFSGITVTANGFYGPQGRSLPLAAKQPQWLEILADHSIGSYPVTNLEMETAGIYALGRLLNMECLSLSAILANRRQQIFSTQAEQTVKLLIKKALEIFSAQH